MKGWRTVTFNALAALPIVIEIGMQILLDPAFGDIVPDEYKGFYALVVIICNGYLRTITTTPIGKAR